MYKTWNIESRENGTFDIFKDGELHHKGVPDIGLERQLAPHGIIGEDYEDVRRQLSETGNARISLPTPGGYLLYRTP